MRPSGSTQRHPAVHPAPAARRDEDNVAVRQPRGLEVVVFAERELAEVRAVGVDRVEVVGAGAARTVREEDRLAIVVHGRVAHAAGRVDEQRAELAGLEVVGEETPFRAVGGRVRRLAEVGDVRVPVRILADRTRGKHDLVARAEALTQWRTRRSASLPLVGRGLRTRGSASLPLVGRARRARRRRAHKEQQSQRNPSHLATFIARGSSCRCWRGSWRAPRRLRRSRPARTRT